MKIAIWQYFRDSLPLKFFTETLIALSFNVGGILAGFFVASQYPVFQLSSWALAVYPAVLSMRGVITGLFTGRLSTALKIGTIHPRFQGNTHNFGLLVKSTIVLTSETSIIMTLFSTGFGSVLWGLGISDVLDMFFVISATMCLGVINTLVNCAIAFIAYNRGSNPDVVVYPIMSTVADIVITVCYIATLNLFFALHIVGRGIVMGLGMLLLLLSLVVLAQSIHNQQFRKTLRESLLTLVIIAFIVNVTGTLLQDISEIANALKEIFTVYPALIDTVGDVGSIVGSTATTELFLGSLTPTFQAIRNFSPRIVSSWVASIIMFLVFALASLLLHGTLPLFPIHTSLVVITNLIAVCTIVIISFAVAILTFKRGLDPDNFVIPVESALADSITSVALLLAIRVVKYN